MSQADINHVDISHVDLLLTFIGFMTIHTIILIWYIARRDLQHRMMWRDFSKKHGINGNKDIEQ